MAGSSAFHDFGNKKDIQLNGQTFSIRIIFLDKDTSELSRFSGCPSTCSLLVAW